jgi:acyl-homoserine-lactone acylase
MRYRRPSRILRRFIDLAAAVLALAPIVASQPVHEHEFTGWSQRARNVTITRDDWGVPHIHGKNDADAVFGLIYAQAEDDFNRIEMNVLNGLGRTAEALGESKVFDDLRIRLIVEEDSLRALYRTSPDWLLLLMRAWADGLNFFIATHREVHPKVITRFEPWMALALTEGSIGWDIESVSLHNLEAFYGKQGSEIPDSPSVGHNCDHGGSNAIAISGALTRSKHALLLINPHTTFFYRAEVHVISDEGLNAYGAVTWGQFFVYQGFNARMGWMHSSTGADAIDEYAETIETNADGFDYRYGSLRRPVLSRPVTIRYRTINGSAQRTFTVYSTHHGPIIREEKGKWVAIRLMYEPVKALEQSFLRTKAKSLAEFKKLLDMHTNSSNNTVYADADGNIAYFHANYIPRRDPRFDWTRPVDGSDTATEWHGIHSVEESPNMVNPGVGWIQNTNNWPYSVSGPDSPRKEDFPQYMDRVGENARGIHAVRLLSAAHDFTLDSLIALGFDTYLTAFDDLLPPLFDEFEDLPAAHPLRALVSDPITLLRSWDRRAGVHSVPTTVAVYWVRELSRMTGGEGKRGCLKQSRLDALRAAVDTLAVDFGTWRVPWGNVNRYQRLTGDIVQKFDDDAPSIPVGFASGKLGSLPAFESRQYPGTKKMYGTSGNSFVAAVEFGKSVRAKAITAGGESGDPGSRHFNDQAERYAAGRLREVYFYPKDIENHRVRSYHPGE